MNVCYVYPYEIGDGPENMALDDALLEAIGATDADALLRVYGWSVPTLSLGYFQRLGEVRSEMRWRDVPIVRRPTGGGAIWHEHELTYALAVRESHRLVRPSRQLYQAVHAAISSGLVHLGIPAVRRGEVFPPGDCERIRPILCFSDLCPEDVVFKNKKIVGSCAASARGAVLQHGSILLARSSQTPELPGICDLVGGSAEPRDWSERTEQWITAALGLSAVRENIPQTVRQQAILQGVKRYRRASWTGIR